jgi:hypothetical protein
MAQRRQRVRVRNRRHARRKKRIALTVEAKKIGTTYHRLKATRAERAGMIRGNVGSHWHTVYHYRRGFGW